MGTKTSDLIGPALDWAVAKCENVDPQFERHSHGGVWPWWTIADPMYRRMPQYSTNWEQGGPIIEREEITIKHVLPTMKDSRWQAFPSQSAKGAGGKWGVGPTPLIAAMRCYVASKMGDEVEIPEELT